MKLITFICPSRNLNIIKSFLDNIESTVKDPAGVECLFKLDEDQVEAKPFIEAEIKKRPFSIKYILTPRLNGVSATGVACNDLFTIFKPDSYFIHVISDEVRFETMHWDEILKKYIGYFPDHVFRLRTSQFKLNYYPDLFLCNMTPDSFAIYTKQWMYLALGLGTHCWASDIINQFIAYYLSLGNQPYKFHNTEIYDTGIHRDIQLLDIKFSGLDFGVGVSAEIQKNRALWVTRLWNRNTSHFHQENFSYLAKRMACYIWAVNNKLNHFKINKNQIKKTVQVIDEQKAIRYEVSYRLPRLKFFVINMVRKNKIRMLKLKIAAQKSCMPAINSILKNLNIFLDKCYCYKELRFIQFLERRRFLAFLKPYFQQLRELDAEMPLPQYGRVQKNFLFFGIAVRGLFDRIFDSIEKKLIGPPPGISDKKEILGFGGSRWPKALIKISDKDKQWALDAIKKQNEVFKEIEQAVQVVDKLEYENS